MNALEEVPSKPAMASEGGLSQPSALTPEVMVFFVTLCFLAVFAWKRG